MMSILWTVSDRLAAWSVRAGGGLILIAALLVATDVILRKLLSITLGGADELAGYALAVGSAWSYSAVLLKRGNVRVDAVYRLMPGFARGLLDLLAVASLGVLTGIFAWYGYEVFMTSWELGSRSNSELAAPLWLPQMLWWAGLTQCTLTALVLLVRATVAMASGDQAQFAGLVGARSIEEDAAGEASHAADHEGEMRKGGTR